MYRHAIAAWVVLFLGVALCSAAATWIAIRIALSAGNLDVPNNRSAHEVAVPRGGGLGIFSAFALGLMFAVLNPWPGFNSGHLNFIRAAAVIAIAMTATGIFDDIHNLTASTKFYFQLVVASAAILADGYPYRPNAPGFFAIAAVAFGLLKVFWLVGFSNFFNFMDGVNGMAGGTGIIYAMFFAMFGWREGNDSMVLVGVLLAASCLGFLVFNFPRAKIFMGDSGSLSLGMLFGFLVLKLPSAENSHGPLVAGFLLCSLFVFDCAFTLFRRFKNRENIFHAHRSHLYQRLLGAGWSHASISILYWCINIGVGALAWISWDAPNMIRVVILLLVIALFAVMGVAVLRLTSHSPAGL